jgi:hypothetical protein
MNPILILLSAFLISLVALGVFIWSMRRGVPDHDAAGAACRARALVRATHALSRADSQSRPGSRWHTRVRNGVGGGPGSHGAGWLPRLKEIIPSYGISLIGDADFTRRIRVGTAAVLNIEHV